MGLATLSYMSYPGLKCSSSAGNCILPSKKTSVFLSTHPRTQFETIVDVNNKVAERNENNNRLVRTFWNVLWSSVVYVGDTLVSKSQKAKRKDSLESEGFRPIDETMRV